MCVFHEKPAFCRSIRCSHGIRGSDNHRAAIAKPHPATETPRATKFRCACTSRSDTAMGCAKKVRTLEEEIAHREARLVSLCKNGNGSDGQMQNAWPRKGRRGDDEMILLITMSGMQRICIDLIYVNFYPACTSELCKPLAVYHSDNKALMVKMPVKLAWVSRPGVSLDNSKYLYAAISIWRLGYEVVTPLLDSPLAKLLLSQRKQPEQWPQQQLVEQEHREELIW